MKKLTVLVVVMSYIYYVSNLSILTVGSFEVNAASNEFDQLDFVSVLNNSQEVAVTAGHTAWGGTSELYSQLMLPDMKNSLDFRKFDNLLEL